MAISRLTLENFRNYRELRLNVTPGFIVLSGANGAGKTNILEAVSLLAPGRGLRRMALNDMSCDNGPGGFSVAAEVDGIDLGTGTTSTQPDRRKTRINGMASATNDLGERLSILWLTPAMDRLFTDSATGRRAFLDRLVLAIEPGHARNVARYDAARRERNNLLSDTRSPDPRWLDGLDEQLALYGGAIAESRYRLVMELNAQLETMGGDLFPSATINLADRELRTEVALRDVLHANRNADRSAGRTLHGPHRSDFKLFHRSKNKPAEKSSTGEQKALLFSVILAQADLIAQKRNCRPILLLDEVAAHLDPDRRAALFALLADKGGQVWLTGTEPALFKTTPDDALHYDVSDGTVTRR